VERPVPSAVPRPPRPDARLAGREPCWVAALTCAGPWRCARTPTVAAGHAGQARRLRRWAPRRTVAHRLRGRGGRGWASLYPLKARGAWSRVWAEGGQGGVGRDQTVPHGEASSRRSSSKEARLDLQAAQEKVDQAKQLLGQAREGGGRAQRQGGSIWRGAAVEEARQGTRESGLFSTARGWAGTPQDVEIAAAVVKESGGGLWPSRRPNWAAAEAGRAPTSALRLAKINVQAKERQLEKGGNTP